MGYARFADVKQWVAEPYGSTDDARIVNVVNRIRQWLYDTYPTFFRDAVECFEVQEFPVQCNPCGQTYAGVTLPRHMQQVEAIWIQNRPIPMFSFWREYQRGIEERMECGLREIDQGSNFCTERDFPPGERAHKVKVLCVDRRDEGKTLILHGTDYTGADFEQTISLHQQYTLSTVPLLGLSRTNGIVKEPTVGCVIVSQEDGRILTRIAPDETVPSYRRIKIVGLPRGCQQVNILASRRYTPLFNDFDVVESDNNSGFQEMARYFRLNEKPVKTSDDLRTIQLAITQARQFFEGQKQREVGKGAISQLSILSPRFESRHALLRTRRRFR
jgi:hypothetical protein